MKRFAKRILERRLELGLTQDDIGAAVELSRAAVSEWERDKNFPGPAQIPALATVLKVKAKEIVAWLGTSKKREAAGAK